MTQKLGVGQGKKVCGDLQYLYMVLQSDQNVYKSAHVNNTACVFPGQSRYGKNLHAGKSQFYFRGHKDNGERATYSVLQHTVLKGEFELCQGLELKGKVKNEFKQTMPICHRKLSRVGTKPGLWTLDWTMDWIMDSILVLILDSKQCCRVAV